MKLPAAAGSAERLQHALRDDGYALLSAAGLAALAGVEPGAWTAFAPYWERLEPDRYLRDGGSYRSRRHASYVVEPARGTVARVPHRAHWQPVGYNALHGGIERWFEPMDDAFASLPAWRALLRGLGSVFSSLKPVDTWYVEAHQFRIDTTGGIGRPTPEGAHRDGVDFVTVSLVSRVGVKGGETRIFEADGPRGVRFTMSDAWTTLVLDDERIVHETTPIQPVADGGHRDTLVLTYRAEGFQAP